MDGHTSKYESGLRNKVMLVSTTNRYIAVIIREKNQGETKARVFFYFYLYKTMRFVWFTSTISLF